MFFVKSLGMFAQQEQMKQIITPFQREVNLT